MGLRPRRSGDALDEVEDGLGRAALLGQHGLDDPPGLGLRETALAQKGRAVLVIARHDLRAGRLDRVQEGCGRGVGEALQRRGGLMGEARGRVFRVPDRDLLEILDAPEVAVLADRAQVEAGNAQHLGPHLGVPAVEPAEEQVGRAIGQFPGLDRVQIIDQEQEDVAIGGIERRRVLGDVDIGVVDAR